MYISKLNLNLKSKDVRRDLSNCYALHRTLCRAYPDKENGGTGRILYRIENNTLVGYNSINIIVVSEKKPDWNKLINNKTYLNESFVKEYQLNMIENQLLRFYLKANPTVKKKVDGKKNGKRVGLYIFKEQYEWLLRKADENGFKLIDFSSRQDEYVKNNSGKNVEFLSVIYEGVLQVTEIEKFEHALYNGIGSAKGFGFGLLSIARYYNG